MGKEIFYHKNRLELCHSWNSIILPGVVICDDVVFAAASVVTKDIPCNIIIAGNSAVVISANIKVKKGDILAD